MKKPSIKQLLIALISLLTGGAITVWACAGGDWSGVEGSMFTPEIINQPQFNPFFRNMETPFYNGYDDRHEEELALKNVNDWKNYLGKNVTDYDVSFWLYKSSLKQIDSMIFFLKGAKPVKPVNGIGSSLAACLDATKAKAFLYFVGFAKRNETFAPPKIEYWEEKKAPSPITTADKQIVGGLAFYNGAKDVFLKERYAFQLVRLYFYTGKFSSAITFYNQSEKYFTSSHNLKWRALGYKAASLYKLQRYSESNYLYSKIYDQFPAYKQSAYLSFHPQAENEWPATLSLATNAHEKEVLWQLQGLYANSITAMREILKLNSKSEFVDLLLVRAVKIEEEKFSEYYGDPGSSPKVDDKLIAFLNEASEKDYGHSPAAWDLAAAYLNYLKGDFSTGDKQLAKAKNKCTGYLLSMQYNITALSGKLARVKKLDKAAEDDLSPEVKVLLSNLKQRDKDLRTGAMFNVLQNKLWKLYQQNGEWEKAEAIWPGQQAGRFDSIVNIKKMITYFDTPKHSEIEKSFAATNALSKEDYLDLLAIRLTQKGQLDEAATLLGTITNRERTLSADPFVIHIKDCHDCDFEHFSGTRHSIKSLVNELINLRIKAKEKPADAAQNYFLLANAFYNITYFGNARDFNSSRYYSGFYIYPDTVINGVNSDLALHYYLLAKEKSKNPEFRATCAFMISKCELNRYYANNGVEYGGDFKAGKHFDSLRLNYSKTKYYAEVIKECNYFRIYLSSRR
ncbi:MAG: hypothetical protein IT236_00055 [Bacteroidia bacterium]|nr:hypothetical protein [Bacteroidia bacterium]